MPLLDLFHPGRRLYLRPPDDLRDAVVEGRQIDATDVLIDECSMTCPPWKGRRAPSGVRRPRSGTWRTPERYVLQYDSRFARRFLATVIVMTIRFTAGNPGQLSCIPEELALRLLPRQASTRLELFGLFGKGVMATPAAFADNDYEDMDHERLYDDSMDGTDESAVGSTSGWCPCRSDLVHPVQRGQVRAPVSGRRTGVLSGSSAVLTGVTPPSTVAVRSNPESRVEVLGVQPQGEGMAPSGEGCRHASNGAVHALVLPDAERQPPQQREVRVGLLVPADVGFELPAPPFRVVLRSVLVRRASVPEAALDEHRGAPACEGDVSTPTWLSRDR